ncbi:hypothetical protein VYU27_002121 [Nannochloropsis oceanica]
MNFFRGLFGSNSSGRGHYAEREGGDFTSDNVEPRQMYSRASSLPVYNPTARPPVSKADCSVGGPGTAEQQQSRMNRSRTLPTGHISWKSPLRSLSSILPVGASAGAEAATAERLVEEAQLRDTILHHLMHAVQTLVKEEVDVSAGQGAPVELVVLSGDLPGVQELCLAVEQACFHGINTASFHGQLPFWDLVELVVQMDKQEEKLRNKPVAATPTGAPVVAIIAAAKKMVAAEGEGGGGGREEELSREKAADLDGDRQEGQLALRQLDEYVRRTLCLRTPVGKARCFLRHALHSGTLTAVMRYLILRPLDELCLFYHPDAILLNRDDSALFLEILESITEHFRLDLTGHMDDPALDHEPSWPLLELATTAARRRRESEDGKDRGILAANLIDDLTHWRLEEDNEEKRLEAFRRVDAFNSSNNRVGQRDPVVDALLETSGVILRHVGEGSGEGRNGGEGQPQGMEGDEERDVVELVEAGGGGRERPYHRLWHEQQQRLRSRKVLCLAPEATPEATSPAATPGAATPGEAAAAGAVGGEEATALKDANLVTPPRRKHTISRGRGPDTRPRAWCSLPSSPTHFHPAFHHHPSSAPRHRRAPSTTTIRLARPNRHTPINFSSFSSPHHQYGAHTDIHHTHHTHGGAHHHGRSHHSSSTASSPSHGPHGFHSPHAQAAHPSSPPPQLSSPSTLPSYPAYPSFDNEACHGPVTVPSKDFLLAKGHRTLHYKQQRPVPRKRKLFGAPLAHLVRDIETCRYALLEPALGVPYIFESMLGYLESHLGSSSKLFETKVGAWKVSGLSKVLDEYQDIPDGSDPPVVAATLNLALRMLPEPVLTFEGYHAFLSAARLSDGLEREASVKCLLRDLPMEHKPTLRRLMHLLWKACHQPQSPGKSEKREGGKGGGGGGQQQQHLASSSALAPVFCRSLLRNYFPETSQQQQQHQFQHYLKQQNLSLPSPSIDPPEAVALTQELIDYYPSYFHELRNDEAVKAQALQTKIQRLSAIVDASKLPADGESDPQCRALFETLFAFLARVEDRGHRALTVSASPVSPFRKHTVTDDFGCVVGGGGVETGEDEEGGGQEGREGGQGRGGRGNRGVRERRRLRSQSLPDAAALVNAVNVVGEEGRREDERVSMRAAQRHGVRAGVAGTSLSVLPTSHDDSVEDDPEAEYEEDEELVDTTPFSLTHPRWERCGFVRGDPGCEMGLSGKLTLRCIVRFIRRFPCIAAEMIFQYSHRGRKGSTISLPALCGQVTRLVLGLLHLLPPSDGQPLSIAAFAQAPYWRLLDDPHAVEEVFCFALCLVDFLHFHESLTVEAVEPHILEAKRQVSWALAQGPVTVQSMWELWLAVRAESRRRYRESHRKEVEAEEEEERRRMMARMQEGEEEADVNVSCFWEADQKDEQVVYKVSKEVRSRMFGRSTILAPWQVITLERSLPEKHKDRDWSLLYTLKKHGAAMHSIFERCKGYQYSLLCLMDTDGVVFGGMASEEWRDRKDRYFGSGESFLFSFKGDRFAKYTWTRANSYFMLASHGIGLAMGGGGHFGLFISPDLVHGLSDHCETYGSATLSGRKAFDVVNIEVWGFGAPACMNSGVEKAERSKGLSESLAEQRDYRNDN